jgi:type I restriction enzyme S subunit
MAAVDDVSGTIAKPEHREIASVWKGYTRFAEGDVLFAKITPCMENGKAAIAQGLINGLGFGSTEFHVLRPTEAVLAKWIFYYVRQQDFRDSAARRMTGTAGQLRVPTKYLAEFVAPVAPVSEQKRIIEEIEVQFTRWNSPRKVESQKRRYTEVGRRNDDRHTTALYAGVQARGHSTV